MQEALGCLLALRLSRTHGSRCTKSLLFCGMLSYRLRIETQPFDVTIPKLTKTSENRGMSNQNRGFRLPRTCQNQSPKPRPKPVQNHLRKLGLNSPIPQNCVDLLIWRVIVNVVVSLHQVERTAWFDKSVSHVHVRKRISYSVHSAYVAEQWM